MASKRPFATALSVALGCLAAGCRWAPVPPPAGEMQPVRPFEPPSQLLSTSPLDLSAVTSISKFRSCSGHDYSGRNVAGEMETQRSMKHYVRTSLAWSAANRLPGFAPFDGTVMQIDPEQFPLGKQVRIEARAAPGWTFIFFHADPLVAVGRAVTAGVPVVAWPPADLSRVSLDQLPPNVSFDIALVNGDVFESPLLRLAPDVETAFRQRGFGPDTAVISKSARDAAPCRVFNSDPDNDFVDAIGATNLLP